MRRKLKALATSIFLAFAWIGAASAANVQQSGNVTPNHIPYWVTNGAIGDGGTSADSPITSIGVTNNGGSGICVNSARQSAAGYNALCLGASTTGAATISLQNYGTASAQALQFVINGTTYAFPGSLANITIGTTPVVGGTNADCLIVSAGVVNQQPCNVSAITSLTGDVTGTGPGVTATTLATVNANTGTFGNGSTVPSFTVNGKGLITAVSTSPVSVTVGTSVINSGSNNGVLFDNGGVLGNMSTLGSAVLITNVGGVPSMATTLPTALTIPTPTFTGTLTFPDAATWTNVGITKVVALSTGSATLPAAGNINVSGQYQVSGSQIAASNLSNGTTGSGNVVLATSPTLSGTVAGSITLSGANTYSGNSTFSAQAIHTGTSAPASAAGNTVIMGTIAAPTLTNTGQAFLYNTVANGAVLEGDGSLFDVVIANKAGTAAMQLTTNTTVPVWPGLANGTCSSGLALDAGNNMVKTSCPGAASSIQVGTTTVTSGSSGNIEYNNAGTLGELTPNGGVKIVSSTLQQDPNFGGFANQNCTITASVASNNLTVALKDNGGSDPTANSPCYLNFRNATAATGSTTSVTVSAATSFVANSGSTFGITNTTATCLAASSCPFKLWVTAINNAGTVVLGVVALTNASGVLPLNEGVVVSTTACNACATATALGTMYSTAAQTSKAFRFLGYLEWGSGLATAGTYASAPTSIQTMGPGIHKPGELIQDLWSSATTATTSTNTTNTVTTPSISMTPTMTSNLIDIAASSTLTEPTAGIAVAQIFRAAGGSAACTTAIPGSIQKLSSAAGVIAPAVMPAGLDTPATTSQQTYVVCTKSTNAGGNSIWCDQTSNAVSCTLRVREIMG